MKMKEIELKEPFSPRECIIRVKGDRVKLDGEWGLFLTPSFTFCCGEMEEGRGLTFGVRQGYPNHGKLMFEGNAVEACPFCGAEIKYLEG